MYGINNYSYLFSSTSASTSTSTNMYKFFAGANQYNTLAKFAIANKYKNSPTDTSLKAPNENTETATEQKKKETVFLSDYENTYKSLTTANTALKNALSDEASTDDTKKAVKEYVSAYNKTVDFLSDNSSSSTSTMNILKTSLLNAISSSSNLSSIGISQDADGKISLDEDKLSTVLSTQGASVKRTLSSLSSLTSISTKMSNAASKTTLVKEQSKASASSSKVENDLSSSTVSYQNNLASNSLLLRNYYFAVAQTGLFINTAI